MLRFFFFSFVVFASIPFAVAQADSCRSLLQQEDLRLWSCGGLKVLTVRGTPEQKAEMQGRLLGKELSLAPFNDFADILLSGVEDRPVAHWFAERALGFWTWLYDRNAPEAYKRELRALAAGADLPLSRVRRALLFPDTALFFWANLDSAWVRSLGLACTSGARQYSDGRFIYGRNLDFAGVGTFDENPLMIVSLPAAGSAELKHLIFGTAGMPFGGLTGVNEAGISFAVHQNYTKDAHLGGVPMPYIGELVLREARTLEQAIDIIRANPPGPLWTFVLTDLNKGQVRAVEVSLRHFEVRSMTDGVFAQTNHTLHDSVRPDEFLDVGTKANSLFRYDKARALLRNGSDGDAAELMARVLSYQSLPDGQLAIHADIQKPLTIQSVILERASDGSLEANLSIDPAPTASGRFAGFKFADLWKSLGSEGLDVRLRPLSATPRTKRDREVEGARAFAATVKPGGDLKALEILKSQKSASALLARAIFERAQGQGVEALQLVKQAREIPDFAAEPKYFRQAFDWIELAALQQTRPGAAVLTEAGRVLGQTPVDPHLRSLASDLAANRAGRSEDADLSFDFFSGYIANLPLRDSDWANVAPADLVEAPAAGAPVTPSTITKPTR